MRRLDPAVRLSILILTAWILWTVAAVLTLGPALAYNITP